MKNNWRKWLLIPALLPSFLGLDAKPMQGEVAPQPLDTIEYRVFIAVDKAGVEHWGGKAAYQKKLDAFFGQVNDFWNKAGEGRLKYYFRYVPDWQVTYDCSSRQLENVYKRSAGFPDHDVLLIIDSILDFDDEESAKEWYCSGGADNLNMVVCRGRSKTEHEDLFGIDYFHRGVAHEFGHYRGVTDLYADRIRAKNNPVNNLQYEPDSCVMNNHYKTYKWSPYAVNIINYTAKSKRPGRDFPGFLKQMFPENIQVSVTVKGKKKKGVKLNLYGSRAKFNDLIATPYRTYETDKKGEYLITGVPDLYDKPAPPLHTDELPYNRWFTFLLEAEYKGEKKYVWLPEYEVQQTFFENKDTYQVTIDF